MNLWNICAKDFTIQKDKNNKLLVKEYVYIQEVNFFKYSER